MMLERAPVERALIVTMLAGMVSVVASTPALAQSNANKVYGAGVDAGKFELGARGGLDFDDDPDKDGKHKHKLTVGYGITGFWWSELIAELEREGEDDANLIYEATEWENRFALFAETESLPGVGLYTALVLAEKDGKADKVEWRAILEKRLGAFRHRFNLNFEKEFGAHRDSGVELGYAWQSKWYLLDDLAEGIEFQPGFEVYGEFGKIDDFASSAEQKHQIGPVLFSEFDLGEMGEFELRIGSLFGLTRASADVTFTWMAEYVLAF